LRTIAAPSRQIAAPISETVVTRSWRITTPRINATTGMKNAAIDALVAPIRPAAVAVSTWAIAVPPAPSNSMASAGRSVQ